MLPLARAAQETFALLYVFHLKVEEVINTKELYGFHGYLMASTFGYGNLVDNLVDTHKNKL